MRSVLIRLEGPLQAWSTQIKLGVRDTDREPSKSGILGLVGAALGMDRDDDATLTELRELNLAVRVDRPGSLLHDYHTAGGGRFRGQPHRVFGAKKKPDGSACVPSHRYYLQDASFITALAGNDTLVTRIGRALESPHWPLFLGRRACVPSVAPFAGYAEGDARAAIRFAPAAERAEIGPLRAVVEVAPGEAGEPRYDVPLSFADGDRRYGVRYVRAEWIDLTDQTSVAAVDAGIEEAKS